MTSEKDPSVLSADEGIPKKYLYWGGAIIVVLVVVLAVVVSVLVTGNNDDAPSLAPGVTTESTSPPMGLPSEGPTPVSPPSASPASESISTLSTVAQRGSLKCGITLQAGFATVDGDGQYSGFDVDLVSTETIPCLHYPCLLLHERLGC